jgi:L-cysteine S-thiosulfotransferase
MMENGMKKLILVLAGIGALACSLGVQATPEDDRLKVIEFYKSKFPDIKFEDYVYGALVFSEDAMAQYNSVMEFPPFETVLEKGQKMWTTPFKNGKTYADCMANGGKNIAGNYPYFDEKAGRVVTFEDAINNCRTTNGEEPLKYDDMKTMGVLTAYARTLSDGMLMNIKVESPGALKAYEDGKKFYYRRLGQLNFSCATCHIDNGGNFLRSEILSPALGQSTHWPVFRAKDGGDIATTLQNRYKGCNQQVRAVPDKEGSTTYNNLEYFHSYMSNGLPLKSSVYRK